MSLKQVLDAAHGWLRARFTGSVSTLPLALFRIAFALVVIVRWNDFTRGIYHFHHHNWMRGIEYEPHYDPIPAIALNSPLIPGLALGAFATRALVWLRTLSSLSLLLGVRARWSAALLGASGFWLMAADRYRYFHHLHLLWLTAAWLALVPCGERLSLETLFRPRPLQLRAPRWSLQALRLLATSVYLSAGSAKLDTAWLRGDTLRDLEKLTLIGGPHWQRAVALLGYRGIAVSVCSLELALIPLLWWRKTRLVGVALGVLLHLVLIPSMMEVTIFNAQMVLLLLLFAVQDRASAPALTPAGENLLARTEA